jgi:dTDP-4-amino-4,6-dideoxygalactose transaminase
VRRYGAILVEDLAHGFFSAFRTNGKAGTVGDISLFSLHKMFPTMMGGMVRYRDPSLATVQQGTATDLAEFVTDYDWAGIGSRRRANFEAVAERLSHSSVAREHCELLWPSLEPTDVPQTLPVRLRGINRDDVYHAMNAEGFGMTSLYHTMIEVLHDRFPEMMDVARSIINFPVHQDMIPDQADAMVRSFEGAVAKARRF